MGFFIKKVYNFKVNSARGPRLSPGFTTYIGIDKTESSFLPSPYSDCVKNTSSLHGSDSPIFKLLVGAGYTYTQETCNNLYIQLKVVEKCGCFSTIVMNINASTRACSSIADNACFLQTADQLFRSNYKAYTQELCNLTFYSKLKLLYFIFRYFFVVVSLFFLFAFFRPSPM
jgi:hypothetical protein